MLLLLLSDGFLLLVLLLERCGGGGHLLLLLLEGSRGGGGGLLILLLLCKQLLLLKGGPELGVAGARCVGLVGRRGAARAACALLALNFEEGKTSSLASIRNVRANQPHPSVRL